LIYSKEITLEIYIPTAGRAHRQPTLTAMLAAGIRPTLVVQAHEADDYRLNWGEHVSIVVLPEHIRTVAPTRQHILQNVVVGPYFCMVDDDLEFFARRIDDKTKLRPLEQGELVKLFADIAYHLNVYAHVGIAAREGANRNTEYLLDNTRIMRVLAYDADVLKYKSIRFDRLDVMEDFDVALQLLEAGYSNVVVNSWAQNQAGSNAAGGCSSWRTPELHAANAHRLAELHPKVVKVVQKETKTAWGGGTRTDVRIQWKRAYNTDAGDE